MMVLIKSELVIGQNYCSQAEVILHQMYNLEDVYDPANDPLPAMGSGSFEPSGFNKTGFISYIQVHVKNENPPREPDVEAYADFPACYQANTYHLAIMYGGPNLSPACKKRKSQ